MQAALEIYGDELGESRIKAYYGKEEKSKTDIEFKFGEEGQARLEEIVEKNLKDISDRIESTIREVKFPDEFSVKKPSWYLPPYRKVFIENFDDVRFPRSFLIENLNEIRVPDFPKEISIRKPDWYKEQKFDFNQLISGIRKENVELYDSLVRVFDEFLRSEKGKIANKVEVVNFPPQVVGGGDGANFGVLSTIRSNTSRPTTPLIVAVALTDAGTAYSYSIPTGTQEIEFKLRDVFANDLLYSWDNFSTYKTIPAGSTKNLKGVNLVGKTIYFKCATASQTVEVETIS